MYILLIPLALLPVLLLLYFIFSKKSGPQVKKAALIALIPVIATVVISAILIFSGPSVQTGPARDLMPEAPPAPAGTDLRILIIMGIFLLLFLGFIIVVALREQRRSSG